MGGEFRPKWVSNRCDDVLGLESDVLDPSAPVILHIFLQEGNKETPVIGPITPRAYHPFPAFFFP